MTTTSRCRVAFASGVGLISIVDIASFVVEIDFLSPHTANFLRLVVVGSHVL